MDLDFSTLENKLILDVILEKNKNGDDCITFICSDGWVYRQYHEQDCCEFVCIEDIDGDLSDLVGCVILEAESVTKNDDNSDESGTWTFYKIRYYSEGGGKAGWITIRWYGSSNGYYSESVSFVGEYDIELVRDLKLDKLVGRGDEEV